MAVALADSSPGQTESPAARVAEPEAQALRAFIERHAPRQFRDEDGVAWDSQMHVDMMAALDGLLSVVATLQQERDAAVGVLEGLLTSDSPSTEGTFVPKWRIRDVMTEAGLTSSQPAARLQINPDPLEVVERRDNVTAVKSILGRSREDRLRVWLALGGTEDNFPEPVSP